MVGHTNNFGVSNFVTALRSCGEQVSELNEDTTGIVWWHVKKTISNYGLVQKYNPFWSYVTGDTAKLYFSMFKIQCCRTGFSPPACFFGLVRK